MLGRRQAQGAQDMQLADLKTPALILDRVRLTRNATAMSTRLAAKGVALRPHLKTAKSAEVATLVNQLFDRDWKEKSSGAKQPERAFEYATRPSRKNLH